MDSNKQEFYDLARQYVEREGGSVGVYDLSSQLEEEGVENDPEVLGTGLENSFSELQYDEVDQRVYLEETGSRRYRSFTRDAAEFTIFDALWEGVDSIF